MRLVHYSSAPLEQVESRGQCPRLSFVVKPKGLWVSDDDAEVNWYSWCEGERYNLPNLACVHDIELAPEAQVLILGSFRAISDFTTKYGRDFEPLINQREYLAIDWPRVATHYQGILISPYSFQARWEFMWYYGRDCASGCIWDAAAIAKITSREPATTEESTLNAEGQRR